MNLQRDVDCGSPERVEFRGADTAKLFTAQADENIFVDSRAHSQARSATEPNGLAVNMTVGSLLSDLERGRPRPFRNEEAGP